MVRCQDLDLYGFPLVGLTGREAAAIAVRADDGKRMQRWRRQVSPSPCSAACITSWQPPATSLHLLSHHRGLWRGSHLEVCFVLSGSSTLWQRTYDSLALQQHCASMAHFTVMLQDLSWLAAHSGFKPGLVLQPPSVLVAQQHVNPHLPGLQLQASQHSSAAMLTSLTSPAHNCAAAGPVLAAQQQCACPQELEDAGA